MKSIKKLLKKSEKGQVLVVLALTITGLVAIMGLAVDMGYMYVSYARLRRSVDSAALSATSQFKRGAVATDIANAARQFLSLNAQPTTNVKIDSCTFTYDESTSPALTTYVLNNSHPWGGSGDAALCPIEASDTPRKLVRVTASEDVPTFFLAVIGFSKLPITAYAISEAASLEMVMVIDRSESMAWFQPPPNETTQYPLGSNNRDPSLCNPNNCHPFQEVKEAAISFVTNFVYEPYDRVGIVTFDQHGKKYDPNTGIEVIDNDLPILTSVKTEMIAILEDLEVTEGFANRTCHNLTGDGSYGGADFRNGFTIDNLGWFSNPARTWGAPDWNAPCRLYDVTADPDGNGDTGWPTEAAGEPDPRAVTATQFWYLFCAGAFSTPANYQYCMTSNIGEGLYFAASVYGNTAENLRQEALWVTLLLTDGNANIGFYASTPGGSLDVPYCPDGTRSGAGSTPYCRDTNALERHCRSANITNPLDPDYPYYCMDQIAGTSGDGGNAKFYWPSDWAYGTTSNSVDADDYDADDYARDQADRLIDSAYATVFAIGLGSGVTSEGSFVVDAGTPAAGHALLTYIAAKGGTDDYYQATNSNLPQIFLAIANKIATRLTH